MCRSACENRLELMTFLTAFVKCDHIIAYFGAKWSISFWQSRLCTAGDNSPQSCRACVLQHNTAPVTQRMS